MGEMYIPLSELADGHEHDKWIVLQNEPIKKKQDPNTKGEIRIKIIFTGPPGTTVKPKKEETPKEKEQAKPVEKETNQSTLNQTR